MKRPLDSGWCQSDHCDRCPHLIQVGNERRREIFCSCRCHTKGDAA